MYKNESALQKFQIYTKIQNLPHPWPALYV